jgi:hypothetical protein
MPSQRRRRRTALVAVGEPNRIEFKSAKGLDFAPVVVDAAALCGEGPTATPARAEQVKDDTMLTVLD